MAGDIIEHVRKSARGYEPTSATTSSFDLVANRYVPNVIDGRPYIRATTLQLERDLGLNPRAKGLHLARRDVAERLVGAIAVETADVRDDGELELRADAPDGSAMSSVLKLTPRERRMAEMASGGPTNRDIAQAVFVTPNAVEVHLSNGSRKLGIAARSQLPRALAA